MKKVLALSAVLVAIGMLFLILAIRGHAPRSDQAKHAPEVQPKWTFKTGGGIFSSVALDEEDNAYLGSEDGYLYAVRPDGRKKWEYETGAIESSPVVTGDTVYVSTIDGDLFAFNKDGSKRWQMNVESHRDRGAVAVSQYNVYVQCRRGAICALDPVDGSERWHSEGFHLSERNAAAVTSEDRVVLGALRGRLYQLRGSDGQVQWRYPAIQPGENETQFFPNAFNAPAIGPGGSIYAGSTDKSLYKFTSGGERQWSFPTSGILNGSPVIGPDETVYIGSEDRHLYAITPTGSQRWKFQVDSQIDSAPAIATDGTIYVTSNSGTVYALSSGGILKWTCATRAGRLTSPAIARDGTIYVTAWNGRLYAISAPGGGLAASAWPKFHHDSGNSGQQP